MRAALDVHRELLARGVPHEVARLRGRAASADDLPRLLDLSAGCVAVRVYEVVREDALALAAVLVPAGSLPDPLALLQALDACTVRLAPDDVVNARTRYAAGLVSPVCLPADVEVLADTAVSESEVSWCALGEGGVALGIRTADLLLAAGARAVPLSGPARLAAVDDVLDLDAPRGSRTTG